MRIMDKALKIVRSDEHEHIDWSACVLKHEYGGLTNINILLGVNQNITG